MKKFYIILILLLSYISSYSQNFELMKLSEAYNYAVSSGSFGSFDFTGAAAIGGFGEQNTLNIENGTAAVWSLNGKPKDGSTDKGLTIQIYKMGGQFIKQQNEVSGDFSGFPVVNDDFADSDALAIQIKNSQEFQSYFNSVTDTLTYISFNLGFGFGDINQMVWTTSLLNSVHSEMLICFWNYKTLEKIQCSSISGVEDKEYINFEVFPNPTTDLISFEIPYSGLVNYIIYDNLGNKVFSSSMNIENRANINISKLDNGVFNLLIVAGKNMFSKRLIKVK